VATNYSLVLELLVKISEEEEFRDLGDREGFQG
jgi:hypothetical protein